MHACSAFINMGCGFLLVQTQETTPFSSEVIFFSDKIAHFYSRKHDSTVEGNIIAESILSLQLKMIYATLYMYIFTSIVSFEI